MSTNYGWERNVAAERAAHCHSLEPLFNWDVDEVLRESNNHIIWGTREERS